MYYYAGTLLVHNGILKHTHTEMHAHAEPTLPLLQLIIAGFNAPVGTETPKVVSSSTPAERRGRATYEEFISFLSSISLATSTVPTTMHILNAY